MTQSPWSKEPVDLTPVGIEPEHKAVFECTFEWARANWDLMVDQTIYRHIHDAGNGSPSGYIKIVTTD